MLLVLRRSGVLQKALYPETISWFAKRMQFLIDPSQNLYLGYLDFTGHSILINQLYIYPATQAKSFKMYMCGEMI
jgi:hypothetical protein